MKDFATMPPPPTRDEQKARCAMDALAERDALDEENKRLEKEKLAKAQAVETVRWLNEEARKTQYGKLKAEAERIRKTGNFVIAQEAKLTKIREQMKRSGAIL